MSTLLCDTAGMTKTCSKCGVEKPLDAFSLDKRKKDGRQSQCKDCYAAHKRDKRATDPVYVQRGRQTDAARRRGETLEPIGAARSADDRFDDRLVPEPNTGCLIWMGRVSPDGYGRFEADGKTIQAHRWAYARAFGPIAPGLEVHHECRNTLCCEPSHLRAVTPEEHAAIHAKEA